MIVAASSRKKALQSYNNISPEQLLKEGRIEVVHAVDLLNFRKKPKWGCYTLSKIMYKIL